MSFRHFKFAIRTILNFGNFPLAAILIIGNFCDVIRSFADSETEKIFRLIRSRKLPGDIQPRAKVKLDQLHAASDLSHLRVPPGNRLEALTGDRAGQHSIRINQQWRIRFVWTGCDAESVEICDYH